MLNEDKEAVGIITMEDVIEELLQMRVGSAQHGILSGVALENQIRKQPTPSPPTTSSPPPVPPPQPILPDHHHNHRAVRCGLRELCEHISSLASSSSD
ncbi:hypothetical protein QJS10_CPB13g00060 [Acorus calamus]|uniref:CBS domain-containing protein n=1 Tax=Acorus calamus TaxID=4465 RepID=A0AAV9DF43_ACOCL|nr:hypothetical protein QJS10_CPB13g00060 [Acorus calamus]